jgi:plastocyanin
MNEMKVREQHDMHCHHPIQIPFYRGAQAETDSFCRQSRQGLAHLLRLHIAVCLTLLFGLTWGMLISPYHVLAAGKTTTIHITGASHPPGFRPSLVSVHVGDSIVFLNDAQPPETYTIIATDQGFVSASILPGQQWAVTFTDPGTHEYQAQGISQTMAGAIIVTPASVRLLPTPDPGAVGTQIAIIQTNQAQSRGSSPSQSGLSTATVLPVAAVVVVLVGLAAGSLLFLRRKRHL